MPRRTKSLEDQLATATEKRDKAKLLLQECEDQISDIKQQIEERDMRNLYAYAKNKGITLDDIIRTFESPKKKVS